MNQPYLVSSAKQLAVIASPGREEIVDAVGLLGPCTVPELAAFLGRTRHALYYHVRVLADCGLLIEVRPGPETARAVARYDVPGRPVVVRYDLSSTRARRAVVALMRSRLRSASRGVIRACRPEIAVTEGPRRNLWVAHWKGWLSCADLEEANALLARLVGLFRHGAPEERAGRSPHELTFALAPILKSTQAGGVGTAPTVRRRPRKR